jgi:hypothetical protein
MMLGVSEILDLADQEEYLTSPNFIQNINILFLNEYHADRCRVSLQDFEQCSIVGECY